MFYIYIVGILWVLIYAMWMQIMAELLAMQMYEFLVVYLAFGCLTAVFSINLVRRSHLSSDITPCSADESLDEDLYVAKVLAFVSIFIWWFLIAVYLYLGATGMVDWSTKSKKRL